MCGRYGLCKGQYKFGFEPGILLPPKFGDEQRSEYGHQPADKFHDEPSDQSDDQPADQFFGKPGQFNVKFGILEIRLIGAFDKTEKAPRSA